LRHLRARFPSKMRPAKDGGSRFGIVLNSSPLFMGGGSGESEIRRYVLENDLVEAIIGLPIDIFSNPRNARARCS
jgi:type I restriction enzyme M protein